MRKGSKHSPETRLKMSISRKKWKPSLEHKLKNSKTLKGKTKSASHSISLKGNKNALGHKWTDKEKAEMSIRRSGKNHPMYGKKHSVETLEKLRNKKVSREAKVNMSIAQARLASEGKIKHRGIQCTFLSKKGVPVRCESRDEFYAACILESMPHVKTFGRCNYRIDYEFKGGKHHYNPDFLVEYECGKKEIIEVKMKWQIKKDLKTLFKIEAGKAYALKNNIAYTVWTEDETKNKRIN